MTDYEYKRYVTTKENLRDTINTYGVAIIPGVLDEDECNGIVSGIWDYFEHITQDWTKSISRSDASSWREIYKLYPLHSMLFQHHGVGQSQVCWDVRQNEKEIGRAHV